MTNEYEFGGKIGRTYKDSQPWQNSVVKPENGAPNIVMFVLDDVGYSDLSCFGSEVRTPVANSLANEGIRYSNFHVTAMCSPTRAALLTGRNAHSVGMGIISEWATGFPGYAGRISNQATTISEMLRSQGYSTMAVGKWHLTPNAEVNTSGPVQDWPCGRGFDRWYGFHGSLADQWHPELYIDNHPVETPKGQDYHLSEDLSKQAIRMIHSQQGAAPGKPFFLYLAFGACHWPHHAPAKIIDSYKGLYEKGWDVVRERRWRRQLELGVIPQGTRLAPANSDVQPWSSLSQEMRSLCERQQEVYAAFLEHTDYQIGKVVSELDRMGVGENTLVILLSDNGASPEGGPFGALNLRKHLRYEPEDPRYALQHLNKLGSDGALNHYATGWAQASNTPFKWYKKDTHGGGIRAPLIMRWPRSIPAGVVRSQYHHVIDIVPTILELINVKPPLVYQGVKQLPIDGISMAYTFDDAEAVSKRRQQLYELLGDRAIYRDGWKAVTRHQKGEDFEKDKWELYQLEGDWSECNDLASHETSKLKDLIELWWKEAERTGVLPLDDREWERFMERKAKERVNHREYTYYPLMSRIDRLSAPDLKDSDYRIIAEIEVKAECSSGALIAFGSRFGGYVLHADDGYLIHEYVYTENERYVVRSTRKMPLGRYSVGYIFKSSDQGGGIGTLIIGDEQAGSIVVPKMWPISGVIGGLLCGRDEGSPIGSNYQCPYPFSEEIERVTLSVSGSMAEESRQNFLSQRASD
jgi:arylsulfatase